MAKQTDRKSQGKLVNNDKVTKLSSKLEPPIIKSKDVLKIMIIQEIKFIRVSGQV
jgi:hypothetical protein